MNTELRGITGHSIHFDEAYNLPTLKEETMSNDDLKYLFEQMLDFIPKDDNYFKNMVKLTKVFKDLADIKELDEVDASENDETDYVEDFLLKHKMIGSIKEECKCSEDRALEIIVEALKADPELKKAWKRQVGDLVIEEVNKTLRRTGGASSPLKNAIKLGASRFVNEFIENTEKNIWAKHFFNSNHVDKEDKTQLESI